jgi:hypothetical protein
MARRTDSVTEYRTRKSPIPSACELCGRAVVLTFHHLIPRRVHRIRRFVDRYGKDELRTRGLYVCRLCHRGIHDLIPDERVLAENFPSRERLLAHDGIARHVAWVAKQKAGTASH